MRRLLAIVCPPLAVLLCGKPISAVLNAFLCVFFWLPGVFHAWAVVDDLFQDKRTKRIAKPLDRIADAMEEKPRKRAPRATPKPELVNKPDVGMNGTLFRKR